jgi:hypothetical protein
MRVHCIPSRASPVWQTTRCAVALAALLTAGCMQEEMDPPAAVATEDTLALDSATFGGAQPDTTAPLEPTPVPNAPPTASRPVSTIAPRDTGIARAVFGTAEIQVDSTTFAPADYLRVVLRGEGGTYETLTDRSGQFVFEDVPAGRYELLFITATKDQRVVHREPVTLTATGKIALPAVHIPVRSLRVR